MNYSSSKINAEASHSLDSVSGVVLVWRFRRKFTWCKDLDLTLPTEADFIPNESVTKSSVHVHKKNAQNRIRYVT